MEKAFIALRALISNWRSKACWHRAAQSEHARYDDEWWLHQVAIDGLEHSAEELEKVVTKAMADN